MGLCGCISKEQIIIKYSNKIIEGNLSKENKNKSQNSKIINNNNQSVNEIIVKSENDEDKNSIQVEHIEVNHLNKDQNIIIIGDFAKNQIHKCNTNEFCVYKNTVLDVSLRKKEFISLSNVNLPIIKLNNEYSFGLLSNSCKDSSNNLIKFNSLNNFNFEGIDFERINENNKKEIKKCRYDSETKLSLKKKKVKSKTSINIAILGGKGVGKSCFLIKYINNRFEKNYIPSISSESNIKNYIYSKTNHNYKLQFSVMVGNEYKEDNSKIYKNSDFFIVMYDLSNIESFKEAKRYIKCEIIDYLAYYNKSDQNVFLVGNKNDCQNQLNDSNVIKFCKKYKIKHYEISVKTGYNIGFMMSEIVGLYDQLAYMESKDY